MLNDLQLQKHVRDLPDNIRNAVEQFDWATEILHIARDHQLQIDDVEIFHQQTLLVIVGLSPAADFKKNLVNHMNITQDLADVLVSDANEHIFRPLQEIAFTHNEEENGLENEIVPHTEISNIMSDHGIDLVDEEDVTSTETESQDINNVLIRDNKISEPNLSASKQVQNDKIASQGLNDNKTITGRKEGYQEQIEERDLRGISKHKIDTSILNQSTPGSILKNKPDSDLKTDLGQNLDKNIFKNPHISKNESFDVSPSSEEQVVEHGDFLKHIGTS